MAYKHYVLVCNGEACKSGKSAELFETLIAELEAHGLEKDVQPVKTKCMGICEAGPVMKILPDDTLYTNIKPANLYEIIDSHLVKGKKVDRLVYDPTKDEGRVVVPDAKGYQKQYRIVLRNAGITDPESIDEYIARNGYVGLEKALFEMTPDDIIEELKKSGLRGRGGAGFHTWKKWSFGKSSQGPEKYVICNADEGDPGAYMDRSTLEGDPHSIIEALIIAGFTINASQGYVYVRAEYPLAIARLENALIQAREYGLLGKDILGSGFNFDIEVRLGAGAFVCGEETALIASIEGERGMPRPRPPYPTVKGLWGKPTMINNVESLANIPVILERGGDWFGSIGTETSKGTKVFALTGKINNSGLIEVPMGTTLREIIFDIGGGIKDGKKFKAAQSGGPSGGVITEADLDTPIDYENLKKLGSIMGSGGLIVMDEDDCMVDVAKFYLEFTVDESCGKCSPCRIGGKQMYNILDRITKGTGQLSDLDRLQRIGHAMSRASLCGLGQTAPNPVVSTLKYFNDEYIAHVSEHRCPAGSCKELVQYIIDKEKCIGCTACARKCPVACISGEKREPHFINDEECIKCGQCYEVCKFDAVIRK